MSSNLTVNKFLLNKLPNNRMNIENAIIIGETGNCPKIIYDPNNECLSWMKSYYKGNIGEFS